MKRKVVRTDAERGSIRCVLTDAARGLIGAPEFACMNPARCSATLRAARSSTKPRCCVPCT